MIFQDPYASLDPRWRVGDIVAEPIRAFDLAEDERDGRRARRRIAAPRRPAIPPTRAKYPHEFSGGQRQRIAIARALAAEADFIVCDEPDLGARRFRAGADPQPDARPAGPAGPDLPASSATTSPWSGTWRPRIGVMYLGRLVEIAPGEASCSPAPRHPYTRMLLDAVPDLGMSGRPRTPVQGEIPNPISPPPGCTFNPRCGLAERPLPARGAGADRRRGLPRRGGRTCRACRPVSRRDAESGRRNAPCPARHDLSISAAWCEYWPRSTAITMMAVSARPMSHHACADAWPSDRQREGDRSASSARPGRRRACSQAVPLIASARISASANAPRKPRSYQTSNSMPLGV